MTEKDLLQKLNALRDIKPNAVWKNEARGLLFSQLSNSAPKENKFLEKVALETRYIFSFVSRPAWVAICIVLFAASGAWGAYEVKTTKPGDSFYLARVLSEKAQLAVTFDKEERAMLDMKFAQAHAKEIVEVMAKQDLSEPANKKKAEKLAQNFQAEITTVKERLEEIGKIRQEKEIAIAKAAVSDNDKIVGLGSLSRDDDKKVHSVESGKDVQGVQIYEPSVSIGQKASGTADKEAPKPALSTTTNGLADDKIATASAVSASSTAESVSFAVNETLNKAQESFNTKDFTGAKDILDQASAIIANIDNGEVKGAVEAGTSTIGVENGLSGAASTSK